MGLLIKFILFMLVFGWIFRGISRLFVGNAFRQAQQQQFNQQRQKARPNDGNVDVEINSSAKAKKKKSADNFKGGDYVDFEEVD